MVPRPRCKQGKIKLTEGEDHASCWVHKVLTVTEKKIQALFTATRESGGKDECQVQLAGSERECWTGTEIGKPKGYGLRDTVTVGDGSNQKGGKMGADYVNLGRKNKRKQMTTSMIYLCDNQALLMDAKT